MKEACLFSCRMFSLLLILLHYVELNLFLCPCSLNDASLAVTVKLNLVVQDASYFMKLFSNFSGSSIVSFVYYYL